ncbi:MAG: ribosome biogenesis GTPase Der [Spirochaetaceae bacterium]|nr:ribosome biogenesis GTPase Der [Spirochaetaceae bacterium]MDE0446068.1 ribosome biogenesis GTPase Der [Spirochaetaceae bacterium]
MAATVPLVTIVGRPNVGKSTLFNRLLARRRAITAATPGVTRDVVEEDFTLAGMRLRLLDTGGIGDDAGAFGAAVAERAMAATDGAAAIMLVVEAGAITPEDERLADNLRAASDRVVVVVNKVDHPGREAATWDFHRLGYETVIGVSAAHGRNVAALQEELARRVRRRVARETPAAEAQDATPVIRLVIGGKPNTGKSTLLNRLLGEQRALVSATPGTTRDPLSGRVVHAGAQIELIDTAGMRRRSKVQDAVEYYAVNRGAAALADADVAVLLVDAREGLAEQDKRIAAIAIRRGVAVLIALSKWDLLADRPNLLAAMVDRIRFQFPLLHFAPVVPLSGLTGFGVDRMLSKAVDLHRQLSLTIPTGKLNQAMARWAREYVPTSRGREIRVRYATQTGTNPVRFVCFLNRARGAGAAYRRFLENRIRRELGFSEVPLTVEFRSDPPRSR